MNKEKSAQPVLKLLTIIIDRKKVKMLTEVLKEKNVRFNIMFNAMGTASSEIKKSLGLSGTEKTVCSCVVPGATVGALMSSIAERMQLTRPGKGIIYTIPLEGISAVASNILNSESGQVKERKEQYYMDSEFENKKEEDGINDSEYSLVVAVIDTGFSEVLMAAARSVGARGGTIIHARKSGLEDTVKFFGITLQDEKEIVTILIPKGQKTELMREITKKCGLNTDAHGIIMSLPVESCSGISKDEKSV